MKPDEIPSEDAFTGKRALALAVMASLAMPGLSLAEGGRTASFEDGAFIASRQPGQETAWRYVEDDRVEDSLAPAVDLYCEDIVPKGATCRLLAATREVVDNDRSPLSRTVLKATIEVTAWNGKVSQREEYLRQVELVRSCPQQSVVVTSISSRWPNRHRETASTPTACEWLEAAPTEKALGIPRSSTAHMCPVDNTALVGNPINPTTMSKIERVVDIDAPYGSDLSFVRVYQSAAYPLSRVVPADSGITVALGTLGSGWRHNFERALVKRLHRDAKGSRVEAMHLILEDGKEIPFYPTDTGFASDGEDRGHLSHDGSGWAYADSVGTVERFDDDGRILTRTFRDGRVLAFTYDDRGLSEVTDWKGRKLLFEYDTAGRMASVLAPSGERVNFTYGENLEGGRKADLVAATYADGSTIQYVYDEANLGGTPAHKLTGIIREDGKRFASFEYDYRNRAIRSARGEGLVEAALDLGSDDGDVRATPNEGGDERFRVKSVNGIPRIIRKTVVTSEEDLSRSYSYDAAGNVVEETDHLGGVTTHGFDDVRNLETTRTEAAGSDSQRITNSLWHPVFDLPARLERGSAWVEFIYNDQGLVAEVHKGDLSKPAMPARVTKFAYGSNGKLVAIDGPLEGTGDMTRLEYYQEDATDCKDGVSCAFRVGDLSEIVSPMGQRTRVTRYDGLGRVLEVRDPNGLSTIYKYDLRGRRVSVSTRLDVPHAGEETVVRMDYDKNGNLNRIEDGDGVASEYIYDDAHRLIEIRDSTGAKRVFELDGLGHIVDETVVGIKGSLELRTRREFDERGLLVEEWGQGWDEKFRYDANGRVIGRRGGSVDVVKSLDSIGRPVVVTYSPDAIRARISLKYDELDKVTGVLDPGDLETVYHRNGYGELLGILSPDTGSESIAYNGDGTVAKRTSASGRTASLAYDDQSRIDHVTYGDGSERRYTYDNPLDHCSSESGFSAGRVASVVEDRVKTSFCYDERGRITRKRQEVGDMALDVEYEYSRAGRLIAMTYPGGDRVVYERNGLGQVRTVRLEKVKGGSLNILSDITWTAFGAIADWHAGTRNVIRTYDLDGRITAVTDGRGDGLDASFNWTQRNQLFSIGSHGKHKLHQYDDLGRIVLVQSIGVSWAYEYDITGNRTRSTKTADKSESLDYVYDLGSNRLASVGDVSRSYDADGNTTRMGGVSLHYDAAGRLVSASNESSMSSYQYNSFGQQVVRRQNDLETVSLFDESDHWIGDFDAAGRALRRVIWLDDLPVAIIDGDRIIDIQADHMGTPRVLIDRTSDQQVWSWSILGEPFGADAPENAAYAFDMRFPGQRFESVTGLSQNHFRDYDPASGRYLQSDPIGLRGGPSTYLYASGRPSQLTDPAGLIVRAIFHRDSGLLRVFDQDDPGRVYEVDARSGGTFTSSEAFDARPDEAIPLGRYFILGHRKDDWFRLDADDEYPLNDVHETTGRDAFRIHAGSNSLGCVTINKLSEQAEFYRSTVAPMLRGTRTIETVDYARRSLLHGWSSLNIRYGAPAKDPINMFGTLEVKP